MTVPATFDQEDPIPVWKAGFNIASPMGLIQVIQCINDEQNAIAVCRAKRVSIMTLPQFRIQRAPSLILVSRKHPWGNRHVDYTQESDHPGVFCEFYHNSRGRFMRLIDAYQYAVYQLRRAEFRPLPDDFPDRDPDLDIAWYPE